MPRTSLGSYGAGVRWPSRSNAPKSHVVAACLNAGELTSIVLGTSSETPPRPMAIENSSGLDGGGPSVGSGKPLTPWARMHFDSASISFSACSDGGPALPGLLLGSSFAHLVCAALNAGEDVLIPELGLSWMSPSGPGSGKFGTPWLRMQSTYARAGVLVLPAAVAAVEEPQAAVARADPSRRSGTTELRWGTRFVSTAAPITAR
jgi:hypothetical protein